MQKQITPFLTIFKNQVFSLCIPINLNQTAVGLFWLGKKKKIQLTNNKNIIKNMIFENFQKLSVFANELFT